jgi:type VI secretion system protein ImpL
VELTMGKILYKALKIFLWLLLFAVLAGLTLLLVRREDWPLWTGAAILLGPIGLLMAVIFLRRHLFRRREKRFVKRIVEQEPDKLVLAQTAAKQYAVNDLRASFAKAREIFKRSRLTRVANPIYSLPWFLLAGQSGTGKSSALRSARLNSLLTDLNPPRSDKPGSQCEWWFQENSVVLDVTGRFLDLDADAPAWWEFLTLLAKHRRRDPLSGLVLAVAADGLLADEEHVVTAARATRQRVDELMRVLGARFPIYLLVTRLDAVPGCDGFLARLDEAERLQAMGSLNEASPETPEARGREIVSLVAEELKTLRLVLSERPGEPNPGLTRFPEAFGSLEQGIALYCRELFQQNPYLETPLFRGLFFASARHDPRVGPADATPLGRFAGEPLPAGPLPGAFLHDLFARILPDDRRLHSPLPAFLSWRTITRFAAATAVLALTLCAAGLFTSSYLRNNTALSFFAAEFTQTPKLTHNLGDDVDLMLRFRNVLDNIARQNAGWALPRLGLNQSRMAEAKLKRLYCDLFKQGVQDQFDWLLGDEAASLNAQTSPDHIQRFASYLLNRIRLVDAAQAGTVDQQALALLHEELNRLVFHGARVSPLFAERYETLHLSYLDWNTDQERYRQEREDLARLLEMVLRVDRLGLGWLVSWANELPGLAPVTMEQFWDTAVLEQHGLAQVPPAFTSKGRAQILQQADTIERTLRKSQEDVDWLTGFADWYAAEYVSVWARFAQGFAAAVDWQRNEDQWREITSRMAEPDNPYLMLLTVMGEQLTPYANRPDNPSWVAPVMQFHTMRLQAIAPKKAAIEEKVSKDVTDISGFFGALSSFATKRPSHEAQVQDTPQYAFSGSATQPPAQGQPQKGGLAPGAWSAELVANKGLTAFKGYLDSLRSLRGASQTPVSSVSLVGPKYSPAPGQPPSPFDTAERSVKDLETALGGQNAPLFNELLFCPLKFFWGLAVVDAAEGLQHLWEEDVLVKVGQMPKDKLPGALFDNATGLVWKFANGPAKPFLAKGVAGYQAKVSNGTTFPFTSDFLAFVNKGSVQTQKIMPSYQVSATALPTDVNPGAQERPYATELTLDCQEKVQQLVNYNYPVSQVFNWDPQSCGKTNLTIRFKSFTASKTYHGSMGFAHFLKEFQYDVKNFTPEDFPDSQANFGIFGIKTLTVQYKLSGGVPIIGLRKTEQIKVPETITKSWGY